MPASRARPAGPASVTRTLAGSALPAGPQTVEVSRVGDLGACRSRRTPQYWTRVPNCEAPVRLLRKLKISREAKRRRRLILGRAAARERAVDGGLGAGGH